MERYSQPDELPYSEFTVNPQPDYTLPGRPLARLVPESYPSEYTHRSVKMTRSVAKIQFFFLSLVLHSQIQRELKNFHGFVRDKFNMALSDSD